ncbi:MAG: septum formation protein Maf [Chloroflexi bacterium]|nr:septum formation protein Maf [Chloroflexota bacterium]
MGQRECVRILPVTGPTLLTLASNSPRRSQLLALGGWHFAVRPADVDESVRAGEAPAAYVQRLAEAKAQACAARPRSRNVVVAADTVVVDGTDILGKPRDAAEAGRMLSRLRGRTHQVQTGIAVLQPGDGELLSDRCVTDVPMRAYSDDEIRSYILTGDPLDKAGAYGIQHAGFKPVEKLDGCYASVMGLPLCNLTRLLRRVGIPPAADVPAACQAALAYHCPVFPAILHGAGDG